MLLGPDLGNNHVYTCWVLPSVSDPRGHSSQQEFNSCEGHQASLEALEVEDKSAYKHAPPNPIGSLPRLGQSLQVEQGSFLLAKHIAVGMLASMELSGVLLQGFDSEVNNSVGRCGLCPCRPGHVDTEPTIRVDPNGLGGTEMGRGALRWGHWELNAVEG
jgi:hypothetical protein